MVDLKTFRLLATSFPDVEELPHFEKWSFRIKKKIFATLDEKKMKGVVKLSVIDQSAFCSFDEKIIYPVPGNWGNHGWTMIDLKKVRKSSLLDALSTAYDTVARGSSKKK